MTVEHPLASPNGHAVPVASERTLEEQQTFRVLLDAMARPGAIGSLPAGFADDGAWGPAALVLQCLLDHEVTFAALGEATGLVDTILRRTGVRVARATDAVYLLADARSALEAFTDAREGGFETPEDAATVVVRCASVGTGSLGLRLTGPGVDGEVVLLVEGLATAAVTRLRARRERFPEGFDAILVDSGGSVVGLPRSTRVELLEGN